MVGKTVGKYRILERIGRGGMGVVYKAVDETLEREVAIKVLNSEFGDAALLKRFRAEAVTLARLNHPGIATIFELHRQQDELLMVMEFVRGETVHELAERLGPLDPPQAAHLCIQVLDALGHAHHAGVIHRDLKPANLMVTESGTVKVMDFGIARVLGSEHFTHGGLMMGTPAYMAPEQVGGQIIDARADLYSMGVVFYRLIAGRLPFVADTAIAMAQKQMSEPPTPLGDVREGLPGWCAAIVDRALAKAPEQRFQTAEEFRLALLSAVVPQSLGELPTLATPVPLPAQTGITTVRRQRSLESDAVALPATPMARDRTTPTTTVVLGRTHLIVLACVLIVLTAGIIVLGLAAFRSNTPPVNIPSATSSSSSASEPKRETAPPVATPAPQPSAPQKPALDPSPKESAPPPPASRGRSSVPQTAPAGATPAAAANTRPATVVAPPPAPVPPAAPVSSAGPPSTTAANHPAVAFGNVRVLAARGSRLYETRGVLRIADGQILLADATALKVLLAVSDVTGLHFSRSRHPRWRDADGKEVTGRVDFGRFRMFRGDRNWFILTTRGEPVIVSVDDALVGPFSQAIESRTSTKMRRFQ